MSFTSIYLISDLHLATVKSPEFKHFQKFLNRLQSNDQLYILGDFFDAWVGDDAIHLPDLATIADALKTTSKKGCALYFMHGNRDFLVGKAFCNAVGAHLLMAPHRITVGSKEYLLLHGDELCTDDVAYQQFRQEVRGEEWQLAFLNKPLEERLAIATHLRAESLRSKSSKEMSIMDVNEVAVKSILATATGANLIHGHTHRPAIHRYENQARMVIPDWHEEDWGYIHLTDSGASLYQYQDQVAKVLSL